MHPDPLVECSDRASHSPRPYLQAAQEANGELLRLVGSAAEAEAERLEVADLLLVIGGQLSSPVASLFCVQ